jgi:hypothetical protein
MAQLRVYMHPSGDSVLYRTGFSWGAAFAFPLWALTRRLYKTAAVSALGILGVSQLGPVLLARLPAPGLRALLSSGYILAYWVAAGFLARRWHRHVLERAGYFVSAVEPDASPGGKR